MRLTSCRYRLIGPGRRPATALVDGDAVPNPKAWLEARLGPLADFQEQPVLPPAASVDLRPDLVGSPLSCLDRRSEVAP